MMTLFAFHSKIDLKVLAKGDLDVCDHHTIEDIGITLGKPLRKLLVTKEGLIDMELLCSYG